MRQNRIFRVRLLACRYSQIPEIDFNESFAPVINDVSFRIIFIAKLIWNLESSIADVETAFSHADKVTTLSKWNLPAVENELDMLTKKVRQEF
jgi:hypothetical protein